MSSASAIDVHEMVVSNHSFGPQEIRQLCKTISEDYSQLGVLRDAIIELSQIADRTPAQSVRLGVCQYLVGRFFEAKETLSHADGGPLAHYYLAKSYFQLEDFEAAIAHFEAARAAARQTFARFRWRKSSVSRQIAGSDGPAGQHLQAAEQTAEYNYQRGATVAAREASMVLRLYNRSSAATISIRGAVWTGSGKATARGNEMEAFRLYERAASCFPAHVGTLVNLGVLYEDRNDFAKAQACYKRILDVYPGHPRARLYMKDAAASGNIYYDEDAARQHERLNQLLSISVNDFELSVRSRNCLSKMGIQTLGDLVRISEQQLLASKNFGETSLVEIRDMLASKGLYLGQMVEQGREQEPPLDLSSMTPDQQAVLDRPISDLNLSVRARKCMVRLGINTIGELIRKTGDDLLESKNFGVTSLNEVRDKLNRHNLKLRGD